MRKPAVTAPCECGGSMKLDCEEELAKASEKLSEAVTQVSDSLRRKRAALTKISEIRKKDNARER